MARSAARRGQMMAQRLDAERLPDPTLGVKFGSERDGQERIVGVQLTIPLPGSGRAASARAGAAEADVASAREALVLARVERKRSARSAWRTALAPVAATRGCCPAHGRKPTPAGKSLAHGEGQFAELQAARRQAIEARLAHHRHDSKPVRRAIACCSMPINSGTWKPIEWPMRTAVRGDFDPRTGQGRIARRRCAAGMAHMLQIGLQREPGRDRRAPGDLESFLGRGRAGAAEA